MRDKYAQRSTWKHLSDRMTGYAQNEIQVAPGDKVQIGFCIYNLSGFVDIPSLQWSKPTFPQVHESL